MNRHNQQQVRALRNEIAHTRAELGQTVQELAARVDVPARAKASARRAAQRARVASTSPGPLATVAVGAAVLIAIVLWSRRDRTDRRRARAERREAQRWARRLEQRWRDRTGGGA